MKGGRKTSLCIFGHEYSCRNGYDGEAMAEEPRLHTIPEGPSFKTVLGSEWLH